MFQRVTAASAREQGAAFEAQLLGEAQVALGLDQIIELIIRVARRIEPWPLLVQAVATMRRRQR